MMAARLLGCALVGACVALGPDDIDPDILAAAQVTYLEGYLFDPPLAQQAFRKEYISRFGEQDEY